MNYSTFRNSFSPVHEIEQEVRCRFERLSLPIPYVEFRSRIVSDMATTTTVTTQKFNAQISLSMPMVLSGPR